MNVNSTGLTLLRKSNIEWYPLFQKQN
jgi:hypothetical protein